MTRYAIIEDEPMSRRSLIAVVAKLRPGYELKFDTDSVEVAVSELRKGELDLVLMDIELSDGSCFEIFNQVKVELPVIFTTSYSEFAIRAFKVNSIDYLLKPVTESDLEIALEKYERRQGQKTASDYVSLAKDMTHRDRLLTLCGDNYFFVNTAEIAWVFSEDKYVFVMMRDGKRHLTEYTNLASVIKLLDARRFFQLSRQIVAELSSIAKVSKWFAGRLKVTLHSEGHTEQVIVSAVRRTAFLSWLGGN